MSVLVFKGPKFSWQTREKPTDLFSLKEGNLPTLNLACKGSAFHLVFRYYGYLYVIVNLTTDFVNHISLLFASLFQRFPTLFNSRNL